MLANVLYLITLAALTPLIAYRSLRFGRYRRGWGEKLFGLSLRRATMLRGTGDCFWLHAVSVGEVNLLGNLVKQLAESAPDTMFAISTSTDTGYDLAVEKFGAERVFFCPLDFTWAVQRTLSNLRPCKLLLAELELWPNLIRLATQANCPVYVFNARLSDQSATGYQKFSRFTRPTFARLYWVGCQDETTAQRFADCGTPRHRLQVTGSLKFDGAPICRDTPEIQQRALWAGIDPWHRVWLVGSTQPGEEAMAIDVYQRLFADHPELRLILVPRHAQRFDQVAQLIQAKGFIVHRRSSGESLARSNWDQEQIILVDTIGELRHWWGVCQMATVGGTFGDRGGQNMLEPAGYGCATSFGPDTRNFTYIANELLRAGGAVRVEDQQELQEFVYRCLVDIPSADCLGRSAQAVVMEHRGGTAKTIAAITGDFPGTLASTAAAA